MDDVQQRHANVGAIFSEHHVPELLRSSNVENLDTTFQGSQQRQEKLESTAPHARCERPAVAVVGESFEKRPACSHRGRARRERHAGASSSGAVTRASLGAVSLWARVTIAPANQKYR